MNQKLRDMEQKLATLEQTLLVCRQVGDRAGEAATLNGMAAVYWATGQPQHERIRALLGRWASEPDDTPAEWWQEFDEFLKANRLRFPERDLGRTQT